MQSGPDEVRRERLYQHFQLQRAEEEAEQAKGRSLNEKTRLPNRNTGEQESERQSRAPGLLRHALWYAKHNFRVFPLHNSAIGQDRKLWCSCGKADCPSKAKHPRTQRGVKDATTDEAQIRQLWSWWPEANIGIATGDGLLVLDVDPRAGGGTSLAALEAQHGKLPETPLALTGGQGRHYYFRLAGSVRVSNSAGRLGAGLDIKTDGGYVVAPPSSHVSGNRYNWEHSSHIDKIAIADIPQWVLDCIAQSNNSKSQGFHATDQPIHEGQGRNIYLYRLGRSEKARGHSEAVIRAAMTAANETDCKPPVGQDEFELILNSVVTGANRPNFEARQTFADEREQNACLTDLGGPDDLASFPEPPPQKYLLDGFIPEGKISILFGDGGSCKSYIALAIGLHIALGRDFCGLATKAGRVLYLDAETHREAVLRRLYPLIRGLREKELPVKRLVYRHLPGPLCTPEVQNLVAKDVQTFQASLVVLDSLTIASGDDMNDAQAAMRTLQVVKSWSTTALVIDHIPKGNNENGRPDKPWGSVFKYNVARSVIRVDKNKEGTVRLEQTKENDGAGDGRLCLLPEFKSYPADPKGLEYVRFTPLDAFGLATINASAALSLDEKILSALAGHPEGISAKKVAEEMGVKSTTVSNRLSKLKAHNQVRQIERGKWVRADLGAPGASEGSYSN